MVGEATYRTSQGPGVCTRERARTNASMHSRRSASRARLRRSTHSPPGGCRLTTEPRIARLRVGVRGRRDATFIKPPASAPLGHGLPPAFELVGASHQAPFVMSWLGGGPTRTVNPDCPARPDPRVADARAVARAARCPRCLAIPCPCPCPYRPCPCRPCRPRRLRARTCSRRPASWAYRHPGSWAGSTGCSRSCSRCCRRRRSWR
jgi:hypothetical protein